MFQTFVEASLSALSEISYGHKCKSDLELKPTFFNLKYEKSTKTQCTIIVFWPKAVWLKLLSFLLPRDNTVKYIIFVVETAF